MEVRLLLAALRRARWLFVVLVLIGLLGAYSYVHVSPSSYATTAYLTVTQPDLSALGNAYLEAPSEYIATQVSVLQSDSVAARAAASLKNVSTVYVENHVAVTQPSVASDAIAVTATTSSAVSAAALANAAVRSYIDLRQTQLASSLVASNASLTSELGTLQKQLAALSLTPAATARNTALVAVLQDRYNATTQNLTQIQLNLAALKGTANFYGPAKPPLSPKPRHTVLIVGIGAFVGLVLAYFVGLALTILRPRFSRKQDVEATFGVLVAAEIPTHDQHQDVRRLAEIRRLAVFVEACGSAGTSKTVLVAPLVDCGTASIGAQLATALSDMGSRALFIEAEDSEAFTDLPARETPSSGRPNQIKPREISISDASNPGAPVHSPRSASRALLLARRIRNMSIGTSGSTDHRDLPDADIVIFEGSALEKAALTASLAQIVDVVILVCPLNVRLPHSVALLASSVLARSDAQVLVVSSLHPTGSAARRARKASAGTDMTGRSVGQRRVPVTNRG